jgi:hypothetical protein
MFIKFRYNFSKFLKFRKISKVTFKKSKTACRVKSDKPFYLNMLKIKNRHTNGVSPQLFERVVRHHQLFVFLFFFIIFKKIMLQRNFSFI